MNVALVCLRFKAGVLRWKGRIRLTVAKIMYPLTVQSKVHHSCSYTTKQLISMEYFIHAGMAAIGSCLL